MGSAHLYTAAAEVDDAQKPQLLRRLSHRRMSVRRDDPPIALAENVTEHVVDQPLSRGTAVAIAATRLTRAVRFNVLRSLGSTGQYRRGNCEPHGRWRWE